ncbi:MAG TPA: FkbM family methyltransferase [Thermoanaerobaculia bacterium]|nr:FkbM family methyltransferase [Thermoanaerobaculia bacterium]
MANLMRRLIEYLSRGRVLKRRLPEEFGGAMIFVTPDAALKLWGNDLRRVDPDLLNAAAELVFPGAQVWDLGANVGLFAFTAAYLAGEQGGVRAVEPDPFLASLLRRSAANQPAGRAAVEVIEAAATATAGTVEFQIAERGRAANHLAEVDGSTQAGGVRTIRRVAAVTLDSLLKGNPAPDVVKIDVEGAELLALRGATNLLAEARPRIFCEVTAENAEAVGALLASFDYDVFDASVPAAERSPLGAAPWNTLAVPRPRERARP